MCTDILVKSVQGCSVIFSFISTLLVEEPALQPSPTNLCDQHLVKVLMRIDRVVRLGRVLCKHSISIGMEVVEVGHRFYG